MNPPKICVIVPTRERADTLAYTLQTCVQQEYGNLEILVCDNFSQDNTFDVVASFTDTRIKYINPQCRLSMADNWEYAISHVKADYVTILGDDDGLLPNSISDLANLVGQHNHPIVTWAKVEYCWPNYIDQNLKGFISIPLRNKLVSVKSSIALKHIYKFFLGYSHGPCIYNSLVSMSSIKQVIERDGRLFQAACPDVYSSLALASVSKCYLFSTWPFSINGASAHSNGTSHVRPDINSSASDLFQKESSASGSDFSQVRGSVSAAIVDAMTNFLVKSKARGVSVNYKKAFKKILNDMRGMPEVMSNNRVVLEGLADKHHVRKFFNKILLEAERNHGSCLRKPIADTSSVLNADNLTIWGDRFDIRDVAAASNFVGRILGEYKPPSQLSQYSLSARILTRVAQKLTKFKCYFEM